MVMVDKPTGSYPPECPCEVYPNCDCSYHSYHKKILILCAAIWFDDGKPYANQPRNIPTGVVLCGYGHASVFAQTQTNVAGRHALGIYEKEQGFLTTENTFVGRKEAAQIALEAGQIKKDYPNGLYSEYFIQELTET